MSDFFQRRQVVARKSHVCEHCRTVIAAGERYNSSAGRIDGEFSSHAEHVECWEAWHALRDRRQNGWDEPGVPLCEDTELVFDDRAWLVEKHAVVARRLGFVEEAGNG